MPSPLLYCRDSVITTDQPTWQRSRIWSGWQRLRWPRHWLTVTWSITQSDDLGRICLPRGAESAFLLSEALQYFWKQSFAVIHFLAELLPQECLKLPFLVFWIPRPPLHYFDDTHSGDHLDRIFKLPHRAGHIRHLFQPGHR